MDEGEGRGEVGVVVNDVREVGHGFSAFVHGGREGGVVCGVIGGGVDGVDGCLPAGLVVSKSKSRRMRVEVEEILLW